MKHIALILLMVPMLLQAQPQRSATKPVGATATALSSGWVTRPTPIGSETFGTIFAQNLSTVEWRLVLIELQPLGTGSGFSEFDLIDTDGKRFKSDVVAKRLAPGEKYLQQVVFHPDHSGPDSVAVAFVFDSAGNTWDTTRTMLLGEGLASSARIMSTNPDPSSPSPGNFVEKIGSAVLVPIRLELDSNEATARVRRITFDIEFYRDAVAAPPTELFKASMPFTATFAGPTTIVPSFVLDSVHIDVSSNAPIASVAALGTLNVQAMLWKGTTTPFGISNVRFFDDFGQLLPGINVAIDTGSLIDLEVCPSALIRDFLTSHVVVTGITPNPAGGGTRSTYQYRTSDVSTSVSITIFNELGLPVKQILPVTSVPSGEHQLQIDTQDLRGGTYIIRLQTPDTIAEEHFVVYR